MFDTIVLFESLSDLVEGESQCQKSGIACQIEPIPPSLSTACGMCLGIQRKSRERVTELLIQERISFIIKEK